MNQSAARARRHTGIALLRYGFRPFFLGAGVWAVIAIAVRLADVSGFDSGGFAFHDSTLWHAHAFLFGYASAVVAGFSLTAVPNWTGRLPISGTPLLALFCLWIAGRVALLLPFIPIAAAIAVDAVFLPVLAAVLAREVLAARNIRNLPVCALVLLLGAANLVFHLEASGVIEPEGHAVRMGVGMLTLLIGLIGGRIVPSFTNNWFARHRLPRDATSSLFLDRIVHGSSAVAVLAWIAAPFSLFTAAALGIAFAAHTARLAQWRGWRTRTDALVAVLHVGYAWIPIGFLLLGASIAFGTPVPSAGLHALTAGAVGTMTLAVMTRATLGHTGRQLHAGVGTITIYGAITASALSRVAAGFASDFAAPLLTISGVLWLVAFALFVAIYGPMFLTPRLGGEPSPS
ncbi:MAG: NnrS family protein [Alphaproteobacteria bacterium]|nr:NnrS family protein [Alphaproteobacteria bacterium]